MNDSINSPVVGEKDDDTKLWAALKAGDQTALKGIYESHIGALLQYGKRFSRDSQQIEDCIHDLFVNLWKNRTGLGMTDSIRRYLLVALRRSIIRKVGKSNKTKDLPEEDQLQISFEGCIETSMIRAETSQAEQEELAHAMSQLTARQQEAIYLRYHKDLAYEDIAKIMEINYQSVRNLVFNGIVQLRKLMMILAWVANQLLQGMNF